MSAADPDAAQLASAGPARLAGRFAERMAVVCVAGLLVLALATTVDVLLRYVFARPIRGFVDLAALAGAVLLAGCMPYVIASRGNIAVDALGQYVGGRARRALDLFAAALTAGFFSVMAWQYLRFGFDMHETAQQIPVLRWPVWPWWMAVAGCILVAAGVAVVTLGHRHRVCE